MFQTKNFENQTARNKTSKPSIKVSRCETKTIFQNQNNLRLEKFQKLRSRSIADRFACSTCSASCDWSAWLRGEAHDSDEARSLFKCFSPFTARQVSKPVYVQGWVDCALNYAKTYVVANLGGSFFGKIEDYVTFLGLVLDVVFVKVVSVLSDYKKN